MDRRKLLKLFGLGGVAGPMAARDAQAMALAPSLSASVNLGGGPSGAISPEDLAHVRRENRWRIGELRRRLADLEKEPKPEDLRALRRHVVRLDPDLAYARSFSMETRLRLQAERNWRDQRDGERRWSTQALKDALNMMARIGGDDA